jgi:hypothetical protein
MSDLAHCRPGHASSAVARTSVWKCSASGQPPASKRNHGPGKHQNVRAQRYVPVVQ